MKSIVEDDGEQLPGAVTSNLERIEKSAARMHNLISGLLAYAQLDSGPPPMKPVALNAVLDDVLSEFTDAVAEAGATVEVADLPEVEGNSVLLHQLFQNLVGNALTYRKPDVPPQIEVRSEVDSRQGLWRISIADNGIGFEPFARLVHSQEFAGSGIGMATAKKIVELHGGSIGAEGEEGRGATFTVTFPVAS